MEWEIDRTEKGTIWSSSCRQFSEQWSPCIRDIRNTTICRPMSFSWRRIVLENPMTCAPNVLCMSASLCLILWLRGIINLSFTALKIYRNVGYSTVSNGWCFLTIDSKMQRSRSDTSYYNGSGAFSVREPSLCSFVCHAVSSKSNGDSCTFKCLRIGFQPQWVIIMLVSFVSQKEHWLFWGSIRET